MWRCFCGTENADATMNCTACAKNRDFVKREQEEQAVLERARVGPPPRPDAGPVPWTSRLREAASEFFRLRGETDRLATWAIAVLLWSAFMTGVLGFRWNWRLGSAAFAGLVAIAIASLVTRNLPVRARGRKLPVTLSVAFVGVAAVMVVWSVFFGAVGSVDAAKRGVAEFRARVTEKGYAEIHRTASPEFRGAGSEDEMTRFMTALERKLGRWQSAGEPAWHVNVGSGGTLVTLDYGSQFEKGLATERFIWRIEHGGPVLMAYNVTSPRLLTD